MFQLIAALTTLVALTAFVGARLLFCRIREMQSKGLEIQTAATSVRLSVQLENVQAADNFRNLFEVPVLFYALVVVALALKHTPGWLVTGSWIFVSLRIAHSLIHCTYNRVTHRFIVFFSSFSLLIGLWGYFFWSLLRA
jgi:hypothetical protein